MTPQPQPPAWTIHLTGDVAVTRASASPQFEVPPQGRVSVPSRQAALVLAMLAVERRDVSRDELAELLWGDASLPSHWPNAVRIVVSKVRGVLAQLGADASAVRSLGGRVSLHLPGGWQTDIEAASERIDRAEALAETDLVAAAELARAARSGITLPVLAGATVPMAQRLTEQAASLVARSRHLSIRSMLESGDPDGAAAMARNCIEADQLDEVAHHLLIQSLLAAEMPTAAWRAYARLSEILTDELGIAPAERTQALVHRGPLAPSARAGARASGADLGGIRFLGREEPLAELDAVWEQVIEQQQPALAVIEGVTGIGKTRLAREFVGSLRARGAQALWGTAHATGGRAYEPFVDALRRRFSSNARHDDDPEPGPALAQLLGLAPRGAMKRLQLDASTSAAARGDIVAELERLVDALISHPTVWVIDDAQWASNDSLAFLDLLLGAVELPLLMVVIKRTGAAPVDESLARWLHAVPSAHTLLGPLTLTDLQPLVADLGALAPRAKPDRDAMAQTILEQTGGHPFMVAEVARTARRLGRLDDTQVPTNVRAWIRHRVAAMPRDVVGVLSLAAIIGERVPISLLQRCAPLGDDVTLGAVERLVAEGFLAVTDDADLVAFPHQITHAAVTDLMIPARRATLHLAVADALESSPAADPAAIVDHLLQSGGQGAPRAVRHALRSAERSLAVGAWEAAETQLRQVEGIDAPPHALAQRDVALGIALHQQGRIAEAIASLHRAADTAREHRCAVELAAAILRKVGRGGRGAAEGMTDDTRVDLLTEALAALRSWPLRDDAIDTPQLRELLTIKVEGELGWATLFSASVSERRRLATAGLRRISGRREVAPELLAQSLLNARSIRVEGSDLAIRSAEIERILSLPEESLSPDVLLSAMICRQEDLVTAGNRPAARDALALAETAARRWESPHWQWAAATWMSLGRAIDGDIGGAEAALRDATERAAGLAPEVAACQTVQLICLRLLDDRAGEVLALTSEAANAYPHIPCYRAVEALVAIEAGDVATATSALEWCATDDFEVVHHDSNRFLALSVLADVTATLGRDDLARALLPKLAAWAGQQVVLNCYAGGGAYWGPVDRPLARLARLVGDARADAWFTSAKHAAIRVESPWALDRVLRDAASSLTSRQ